jgi:mono/diheme cytochrome c family protein
VRPLPALLATGLLAGPVATLAAAPAPAVSAGEKTYLANCAQCHGEKGDGQGPAAVHLRPPPRDFTSGKFKIRSTPSGQLPTDADLRRVIRQGMPYTSMPAWTSLTDAEVDGVIQHVKSFSPDFQDPSLAPKPIDLPKPPPWSKESAAKGREVYASLGCARCHGETGKGEGPSAPTLKDDKGRPIRPADLTHRWTFRGGPRPEDIFRTFSTGLNGTPMPSFYDSLDEKGRWVLTDYVYSLGEGDTPDYATLLVARPVDEEVELSRGTKLFDGVPTARFPIVGQIMQRGRDFAPSATGVEVRAVFDDRKVAFLVSWHDMRADTAATNSPTMEVPLSEEDLAPVPAPAAAPSGEDFWGQAQAPAAPAGGESGEGFWGEAAAPAAAPGAAAAEFSDAVAIQLPAQASSGIAKPYFLFGDAQNAVDLWFLDLAGKKVREFTGHGSQSLTPAEDGGVRGSGSWTSGEWSAVFVRDLRSTSGLSFAEGQYVPIAFSVWDGTARERGNRRGLTQWFYVYFPPRERPSVVGPMVRAALGVFALEALVVLWIRRKSRPAVSAT